LSKPRSVFLHLALGLSFLPTARADAQSAWSVRDSLGVRVVENEGSVWTSQNAWQVSPDPDVVIGELEGADEYMLFRATWSGFLSDGSIVVMNGGSGEVRIYDAKGRHVRSFGSEGDGPGEFREPGGGVVLPGDTIVIQDGADLQFYTRNGQFVRQSSIVRGQPLGWPYLMGMQQSRLLFLEGDLESRKFNLDEAGLPTGLATVKSGVDRGAYALIAFDLNGTLLDTISTSFGGGETWISQTERSRSYSNIPFSPGEHWGIGPTHYVTGHSAAPSIRFLDNVGRLKQVVRLPLPHSPIEAGLSMAQFERSYRDEPADIRERARKRRELMPTYEHFPLFTNIRVDPEGFVWLASYSPVEAEDLPRWFVVSPEGRYMGEVGVRQRMRIDYIGRDFILGRRRGEFDVEQVVVYAISR
jgi:hypothetical protein